MGLKCHLQRQKTTFGCEQGMAAKAGKRINQGENGNEEYGYGVMMLWEGSV